MAAETTRKSLAAFVESTIKFRISGMAEILAQKGALPHSMLHIRMDEDRAILGILRSFKGWKLESSSESLTGLKEAVKADIKRLEEGGVTTEEMKAGVVSVADLEIYVLGLERILKLIEEREQASK